ncbi:MAG: rhodanese-related sulfurtransferase [Nanoarchaeota archaeon]|nr:rhodanese-related sulfurtransferase [Nanoarchaeota archaeon]
MKFKTITFYKFFDVSSPEELLKYLKEICESLELKGRILIGKEGINAGVSGEKEKIKIFIEKIKEKDYFKDLTFRETDSEKNSYHKLVVRIRQEIITLGKSIDMKNKADYISPAELKQLFDKNEDFVILDTRNEYEARIGRFKNSLFLKIENFRDFPNELRNIQSMKNKKIITCCTGGIRCEKATALMKQEGFENVLQLRGGIIEYVNNFPGQEFEGDCFVFDDRLTISTGSEKKLEKCEICGIPCNDYIDCHNMNCDRLFISCKNCQEKMNRTCCDECKNSERQRPENLIYK